MSNRPNFRRGAAIAEFAQRRYDEGSIEIPITDGDPVVVPPREFWPQHVVDLLVEQARKRAARKDRPTDEQIARALLGDDEFERFAAEVERAGVAAEYRGGAGSFLFIYLEHETERLQGVSVGE